MVLFRSVAHKEGDFDSECQITLSYDIVYSENRSARKFTSYKEGHRLL